MQLRLTLRIVIALVMASAVMVSSEWVSARQNSGAGREAKDAAEIAGVWKGHSVCEDKSSPCHDEINVYRFTAVGGKTNVFSVTASKIVDGKEIVMGSSEWKYDEKTKTAACENPAIKMTVEGKKMEGALSLPDGKVYRRIYLSKEG